MTTPSVFPRTPSPLRRNVLLVDDSATIRQIIQVYLMGKGFDFFEADCGERALQLARLTSVSLVIADIKMPGMDGLSLTRELRKSSDPRLKDVPVILLTGEEGPGTRAASGEAGANALLRKPVSAPQLQAMVQDLLTQTTSSGR